jgi:hypothetical protein
MYGWSFAARTVEEVGRLLRAMETHRYLAEKDLQIHWSIDMALAGLDDRFAEAAVRFQSIRAERPQLEMGSRDPVLWRAVDVEQVLAALAALWEPGSRGDAARAALSMALRAEDVPPTTHAPFDYAVDEPPHPELVLLDWSLLPIDELDTERHAGALRAMEDSGDEVDPSESSYVEGPTLTESELTGLNRGILPADPVFWADGPYSYCDYVFRGVARAARLVDPPCGYRDFE